MKALVFYPQYGFANRLRAIASARILADYTGRRLLVNWIPSVPDCNIAWEDLFVNQLEAYPQPLSTFQSDVNLYDDTGSHDFYWDMPQSLAQNNSDVVALRTFRNFRPKGMTEEDFKHSKSLFYKSLNPVSAVQKAVNAFQEQHFKHNEVIGVHIRRTDYFSHLRQDPKEVAPTELFINRMARILKTNPKVKFFLATDDKHEEQIIRSHLQDALIAYEKDSVSRATKNGMQDALADWLLLSRTSRMIASYRSSFSEEAGIVNMISVETIPKRAVLLNFKAHYGLLRKSGLKKVLLYSYYYRKEKLLNRIKKILR
jgi:hypothetical protein